MFRCTRGLGESFAVSDNPWSYIFCDYGVAYQAVSWGQKLWLCIPSYLFDCICDSGRLISQISYIDFNETTLSASFTLPQCFCNLFSRLQFYCILLKYWATLCGAWDKIRTFPQFHSWPHVVTWLEAGFCFWRF